MNGRSASQSLDSKIHEVACQELKVEKMLRGKMLREDPDLSEVGILHQSGLKIVVLNFIRMALAMFILDVRYLRMGNEILTVSTALFLIQAFDRLTY